MWLISRLRALPKSSIKLLKNTAFLAPANKHFPEEIPICITGGDSPYTVDMSEKKQLKKIMLICHSEREKILKEKLAPIVSEYEWIDISSIASYSQLQEKISDKNSIILMDLDSISAQEFAFEENWLGSDILLIGGSSQDVAAAAWKNNFSSLCLESQDFLLALELGINQEKFPGIFALAEEGSEIYFEKVQSLREIGAKIDRFVALLGQKYPAQAG